MLECLYAQHDLLVGEFRTRRFVSSVCTKREGQMYRSDQGTFLGNKDLGEYIDGTNEDALFLDPYGAAMLFDGVGSSVNGAGAARLGVRDALLEWNTLFARNVGRFTDVAQPLLRTDQVKPEVLVRRVMSAAHEGAKKSGGEAAAALAFFMMDVRQGTMVLCHANVGDTRVYILESSRSGRLRKVSVDDSILALLTKGNYKSFKRISPNDAWKIDQATDERHLAPVQHRIFLSRNGISQSLGKGNFKDLNIHIGLEAVYPGDKVCVVTDGMSDNLTDDEIGNILSKNEGWDITANLLIHTDRRVSANTLRSKPDDMSGIVFEIL